MTEPIYLIPIIGLIIGVLIYRNGVRNIVYTDYIVGSQRHNDGEGITKYYFIVRHENRLRTVECQYWEYLEYSEYKIKKYSYKIKQVK